MDVIVRASVLYLFVLVITRALGRRELAEMTPFELVVLVVMGDLIQQGVTQEDYSITGAMLAVSTMAMWSLVFSYLAFRKRRIREIVEGEPALICVDGAPVKEVLEVHRLSVEDLLDEARTQGIAHLSEVRFAVVEPGGTFSFVRKEQGSPHPPTEHRSAE